MNKIKHETENYSLQININQKEKLELNKKINELTNILNQKKEEISNIKNINNRNEKVLNAKSEIIGRNYKNKFEEEFAKLKKTLIKSLGDNLKQIKNKYNEQYSKREKIFDDKFNELKNSVINSFVELNKVKNLELNKKEVKNNYLIFKNENIIIYGKKEEQLKNMNNSIIKANNLKNQKDFNNSKNKEKFYMNKDKEVKDNNNSNNIEYLETIKSEYEDVLDEEMKKMKKILIKVMCNNLDHVKNKFSENNQLKEEENLNEIKKLNINNLKEENINLLKETNKLKKIISRYPLNLSENEYILILLIMTKNEKIIFPLLSKNTDKFGTIENKFFEEYPEYNNNGNFLINNNLLDKEKTLEECKLKNNDIIIFEELNIE